MSKIAMTKCTTKDLEEVFNDFIKYCKVKNLSEQTLEYYITNLNIFKKWLKETNIQQLSEITKESIDKYIAHFQAKSVGSVTINTRLRAVRAFIYYCMELEYTKPFKMFLLKEDKKIKETYTDAEIRLLLKKPDVKQCLFSEYRNWVIVNYLLSTGNRVRTIMNLKIEDVDFENCMICMKHTKNRKQQLIPLTKAMLEILREYLKYRKGNGTDFLFCSSYNEQLQRHSFAHSIYQYNKKRGVMKTSIHLFRHTFAKKWILAGGDVFRLQKILGHSNLEIVKEYVNMFTDDLKIDFEKFNPLEQFMDDKKEKIKMK